jgi:hypothetical protein
MILILTRNDLDPKFNHLPGHEITLEHTNMAQSSTTARSRLCFYDDVVFLNEDDTIDVLKEPKHSRKIRKYPSVLHYVASRLHRHVPLISLEELREIGKYGERLRDRKGHR